MYNLNLTIKEKGKTQDVQISCESERRADEIQLSELSRLERTGGKLVDAFVSRER